MKFGTTDHCLEVSVMRGSHVMLTSQQKLTVLKFAFLDGEQQFLLKRKPVPNFPAGKNFMLLRVKVTSQFTHDCKICFLYFL